MFRGKKIKGWPTSFLKRVGHREEKDSMGHAECIEIPLLHRILSSETKRFSDLDSVIGPYRSLRVNHIVMDCLLSDDRLW